MLRPYPLPLVASLTLVLMLLAACSDSADDSADTTLAPDTTVSETTTAAPTTTIPTTLAATTTQTDATRGDTDRIIQAWIDGWLADDPDAVIALYTENGIYADAAYPFEYEVGYLVRTHMGSTTYTAADRLNVTYTDTGATVDWLWEGTHSGSEFSMNAATVFEIQDGKIVRSTDSYERCTAPWTSACDS